MSRFNRYLCTILMINATLWMLILFFGVLFYSNDPLLTKRIAGLTVFTALCTWLFYQCESRTRWSTDSVEPTVIGD